MRTLFYSSTASHEHLANLSAHESGDPPTLRLTHLLPASGPPPPGVTTIPLLSSLDDSTPPRARRATHDASSLLTLLPPTATISAGGAVRLHAALPRARWLLGREERERDAGIRLASSATGILSRGGSRGRVGILVERDGALDAVPLQSSGTIAGAWAVGGGRAVTIALLALAAGLARRGHGEWAERRIVIARFEAGRAYFRRGVIAVADGGCDRFIANVLTDGTLVSFTIVHNATENISATRPRVLGDGWMHGLGPLDARERAERERVSSRRQSETRRRETDARVRERRRSGAVRETRRRRPSGERGEELLTARMREMRFDDEPAEVRDGREGDYAVREVGVTATAESTVRIVNVEVSDESDDGLLGMTEGGTETGTEEIGATETDVGARGLDGLCRKYLRRSLGDEMRRHLISDEGVGNGGGDVGGRGGSGVSSRL